jgi:uncharacterized cupredoxin-like copper-binding protein
MKRLSKAILIASVALSLPAIAGSFQVGTVKEFAVGHDGASFQLDTTQTGIDIRESCLDPNKELSFRIDFTKVGGMAVFETVMDANKNGTQLQVNGDGVCIGDEQETADRIVPSSA